MANEDEARQAQSEARSGQLEAGAYAVADAIRNEDRAFDWRYRGGLVANSLSLWASVAAGAGAAFGLERLGVEAGAAAACGIGVGALIAVVGVAFTWIFVTESVERHFRRIRTRAAVASERVFVDDDARMRDGVSTVIFEWFHVRETLRRKNEWSLGFIAAAALHAAVFAWGWREATLEAAAGLFAVPLMSALGVLLAGLHGVAAIALGVRVFRARCMVAEAVDPASVLQRRMGALLTEVKDLRRRGTSPEAAA